MRYAHARGGVFTDAKCEDRRASYIAGRNEIVTCPRCIKAMNKTSNFRIVGVDAALNHTAVVLLIDGKLKDYAYYTKNAGAAKQSRRGSRLVLRTIKPPDMQMTQMSRLEWVDDWFESVFARMRPTHVFLEDYALDARSGHYTGELGGLIRMRCFRSGYKLRLHDPLSVKMFVAENGHAQKDEIEAAVKEKWGIDFSKLNPPAKGGKVQNREVSQDMCDAFGLAMLGQAELKLRFGETNIKSFSPKQIQVFNRVTKLYPTNLLGREFIEKDKS